MGVVFVGPILASSALPLLARPSFVLAESSGISLYCSSSFRIFIQLLRIPDICHQHHKRCLWRKNLSCGEIIPYDKFSCGELSPHEKCEENIYIEKVLHMTNVEQNVVLWRNVEKSVMWRIFST